MLSRNAPMSNIGLLVNGSRDEEEIGVHVVYLLKNVQVERRHAHEYTLCRAVLRDIK